MWISTIFIVTLALGSLNLAAAEEKIADEKTDAVAQEKVQEKRQISGHTKVPQHPTKLGQDFTPLIYGAQVTPGLGQYAIPDDPSSYGSAATARKLPNNAANNYLKLAQTQGQLSPSVAPQQYHVESLKVQQQQPLFLAQAPRVNTISDAEYLNLIQNAQKYQAAAPPQAQHFAPIIPQHQAALLINAGPRHQYAQLYQKQASHPLADSSLEREIEKLVAANAPQQTASSQRQTTKVSKGRQFFPKNQHNFVFIPYQPQALQQFVPQQQFVAAAAAIPQATHKQPQQQLYSPEYQQQISKFHQFLPQAQFIPLQQQHHQVPHQQLNSQEISLASPIQAYYQKAQSQTQTSQSAHNSPFLVTKEPKQVQQQHQQTTPKTEQPQKQQPQQPAAHSTIFVSHSTSTPPFANPTKQSQYSAKATSHSQETQSQPQLHSSQTGQVSINALAASIFKTPPSQQRPLTQEEFQALVDAGYPVTPIHVPVPVPITAEKYESLQQAQHHNAAYALPQQQQHHQQQPHHQQPQQQFKYSPQPAGSQYQPAILSPATFYAPQPPHHAYYQQQQQQQREQRDTSKDTKAQ
ncbi:hypothetical protein DMENIID0001_044160 [Sergentomyia squamirostris]